MGFAPPRPFLCPAFLCRLAGVGSAVGYNLMMATTFALALGIPKLLPHANPRHVIQAGYVVMAAALGVMALSVTIDGSSQLGVYLGAFLAGVGAGTVSSHASNVVALALPERDASQSGGIQSTMRNVGQALGVALLGAVLLFGITNTVRSGAVADTLVSRRVSDQLAEMNVNLGSNQEFEEQISKIPMSATERGELVRIDALARTESTRVAYAVGGVIVLLGLLTTPAITTFEKPGASASASGSGAEGATPRKE